MATSEPTPIAIIGMACRYPGGADSPEKLWSLLEHGKNAWREFPKEKFNWDAFYHPHPEIGGVNINHRGGHYLEQDIAAFDAAFFGVAPLEAEALDPQQRIVLEVSWEAVENAGVPIEKFRGSNTSVYVAMLGHDFEHTIMRDPLSLTKYHNTGAARTLVSNRVSYCFDLQGPSILLDTGCSGSLVSVNLACQSLRAGESDMALAGGVGMAFSPEAMAILSMPGVLNPDGRCYAFDDRGQGYGRGEGAGMIALKRLDDAIRDGDNIRAVIRNSAANQDGRTNGITLPSQTAQERLGRKVFEELDFKPPHVQYVEAHGTGTKAGDAAELNAIHNVFCEGRPADKPLLVGTLKPNIGHTGSASGAAGIIKTVLAMEKGMVPPNLLLKNLKPGLTPKAWNIQIPQSLTQWPATESTRKAIVNSFGSGGTNAMVVLESPRTSHSPTINTPRLFTLSAKSESSLSSENTHLDLDDLSYTLTARRSNFQWRSSIVANDSQTTQNGTVFVFTGQGAQWARMGYCLMKTNSAYSRSIRHSDQKLKDLGATWSLVDELSKDSESTRLNDSTFGQPASTAVQIALVDLLREWRVHPAAVIGHSSGEIAAAYAAGAITHDSAIHAAYHRSFLAAASKDLCAHPGAMMAVGLGKHDVERYISNLSSSKAVVACVNSPSSTTISGDAPAIMELKQVLDGEGIFARLLKVDTAYHSHHMELVGGQYLKALGTFDAGTVQNSTRFFSTVTGDEKHDGFGAGYWVDNLVFSVQFCDTIQRLSRDIGLSSLTFVEVGPHKALAGPIRQSLDHLQEFQDADISYNYISTLVRLEDDLMALMHTGSALFRAGSDIDTGVVASLGILTASPKVISDLPPYHWNHDKIYWSESRLSRDYRHKRHPYHDLLGSRVLTSPDHQPSWRVFVGIDSLPWLKHHVVDGFVVLPGAGYIAMAVQAIEQLRQDETPGLEIAGFRIRNVSFKKALYVSSDSSRVEVVLNFKHSPFADYTYDFSVASIAEGGWQENCDGTISLVPAAGEHKKVSRFATYSSDLQMEGDFGSKTLHAQDLYTSLASQGNYFGPTFAIVDSARLLESRSLSKVTIPDIAATMPGKFMHPHVIHPALYDALMHVCVYHFQQKATPGSAMATFYSETFISADILNQPGTELQVVAELSNTSSHLTHFNIAAFQDDSKGTPQPVLTVTNGEFRIIGSSRQETNGSGAINIFTVQKGLDASSVTADMLESITTPLQCSEAGMSQAEKLRALHSACAKYFERAVEAIEKKGLKVPDDHRQHLWQWSLQFLSSHHGQALLQHSPQSDEGLVQELSKLGVEGELVASGEMDGLALFLEDDSGRGNRYMAEYAKKITFQNNGMRILEIGAGTGGATLQVLRACSPNGERFCSEYMYTDVSAGFFETARTTIVKDWAHLITFQTLDLENDPTTQRFEEHAYDLIIASNVVHATASLKRSLGNIHKLLKPGGVLGLVELITETPYHNMTFGLLSGWWLGTIPQWDQILKKSSFSGVEVAAYDFPEPARGAAFFTSTATSEVPIKGSNMNGHSAPMIEILDATLEQHNHIRAEIVDGLVSKGFSTSISSWSETKADSSTSYLILESIDNLLLKNASPEQFSHITSLLSNASKIYWVTLSGRTIDVSPDSSLLTGFARSARSENENLRLLTLDIQDDLDVHEKDIVSHIVKSIQLAEEKIKNNEFLELDTVYRDGKVHIERLISDAQLKEVLNTDSLEEDCDFRQGDRPLHMRVEKPGLLNSMFFADSEVVDFGEADIQIQSHAWGVNSSDVLHALGKTKPGTSMLGEGAGVVTRVGAAMASKYQVGDRVAVLFGTPFANQTRTSGHFAYAIPDSMSFESAASIPVAFTTAYYALVDIARLRTGQTILIHSATSDLGRAAIQLSQDIGAVIFATTNSRPEAETLSQTYSIPLYHIFSDQADDFGDGIMQLTRGQGADVVMNTLTGDGLQASLECVAKLGTFLEMGKTDINRRNRISMEPFDRNIRFASVDISDLLQRAFQLVTTRCLTLPTTTLPIGDIEKAFRLVGGEKQSAKVILTSDASSTVTVKSQGLRLRPEKTYVIVGGLGTLGRHLCSHLQSRGARHIAIVSRQQLGSEALAGLESSLKEDPESLVNIFTADITDWNSASSLATDLASAMPPVAGLIQGAMVLSDLTLHQMGLDDFQTVVRPKDDGTKHLAQLFPPASLDCFILLSSLADILGSLSQANYAAASTYQDMFANSMASRDQAKIVSIDLPLIQGTHWVSDERTAWLARQGGESIPMEAVLSVIDFAMSGRASKSGCSQVVFGVSPEYLRERPLNQITPLLRNLAVGGQNSGQHADKGTERSIEDSIAHASTVEDATNFILEGIRAKLSSLTTMDLSEISLDMPVTNLGLDSLIAIEIKNWITNTLQAPALVGEIIDCPSLKALATIITERSGLVKRAEGVKTNGDSKPSTNGVPATAKNEMEKVSKANGDQVQLPKLPLPSLEATFEVFLESEAINDFLRPEGSGRRLQQRLERIAENPSVENWLSEIYKKGLWLKTRDNRPRLNNFFGTHRPTKHRHSQAEKAALVSLAAYRYKVSLVDGTVAQDYSNDQPLCMEAVHWLFNTNRVPAEGCDHVDSWPGNDYLVAMRRGHVYKVWLRDESGKTITHSELKSKFQFILEQSPSEANMASVLTTGNRDVWAKTRKDIMSSSPENEEFISTIEKSLFAVCLDDGRPENSNERAACFLLDDNTNRWLDKTVSFIVCANGVSATWYEHAMVDGSAVYGMQQAISDATIDHVEAVGETGACNSDMSSTPRGVTYLPFSTTPELDAQMLRLRSEHVECMRPYSLRALDFTEYGAAYLRSQRVPPRTVFQLMIQVAVRLHYGYNPNSLDVASLRHFRLGRVETFNVQTAPVTAFCAAMVDASTSVAERQRLLAEAVKSHARLVALTTRGRSWARHLMALKEVVEPGEEVPALYADPLFEKTKERKVFTSFGDSGCPELGTCWADKSALWIACEVADESARFVVINGEGRADEFLGHILEASKMMRGVIESAI
ncbi:polyketide synthase [Astrocystis sublimbata]|nr:polyketide synthase [Astrocystis sublimbata]